MAQTIIWSRAQSLFKSDSAIVVAPGEESAFIVQSISGKRPHYVQPSKAGGYVCDDQCLGYKSVKLCAHTVAAALKADKVGSFLRWYKGLKAKPNFSALAGHEKPSTAGKKGISKKGSKHVQNLVLNSNEEDFSSRILNDSGKDHHLVSPCNHRKFLHHFPSLPCGSDVASAVVAVSNSPISVHNYGYHTLGQSVHNVTGPPPLVHIPIPFGTTFSSPVSFSQLQTPPSPLYGSSFGTTFSSPAAPCPPVSFSHQPSIQTPPPLYGPSLNFCPTPIQERPRVETEFWLCFVRGNISRCNGCKGKIGRCCAGPS